MKNEQRGTRRVALGPNGEAVRWNVQRLRKLAGLKQSDLSANLATTNRPMSVNTISEIELGARKVDVDDLLALSAALNVAPNALLLPPVRSPGLEMEVSGFGVLSLSEAWDWMQGLRHPRASDKSRELANNSSPAEVLTPGQREHIRRVKIQQILEYASFVVQTEPQRGTDSRRVAAAQRVIDDLNAIDPSVDENWPDYIQDPAPPERGSLDHHLGKLWAREVKNVVRDRSPQEETKRVGRKPIISNEHHIAWSLIDRAENEMFGTDLNWRREYFPEEFEDGSA